MDSYCVCFPNESTFSHPSTSNVAWVGIFNFELPIGSKSPKSFVLAIKVKCTLDL